MMIDILKMSITMDWDKQFQVNVVERNEWLNGKPNFIKKPGSLEN